MRQIIMASVLGLSLLATLSATAERDLARIKAHDQSIGLDPNAPAALLTARLNITTIKKTPLTR